MAFNIYNKALELGFSTIDAAKFTNTIQLSIAQKTPISVDNSLAFQYQVQLDAAIAGITNLTTLALLSKKSHLFALGLGFDITTALTFDTKEQALACDISNNAPLCNTITSTLQLKALNWNLPVSLALTITHISQIAGLVTEQVSPTDAIKFSNAWQMRAFLISKNVTEALIHPTPREAALEELGVVDEKSVLSMTFGCTSTASGLQLCQGTTLKITDDND